MLIAQIRQAIQQNLRSFLRPIARLAIKYGVCLPEVYEALKQAYVDEALIELKTNKDGLNVTKISVMSGVHRKDVTRIINSIENLPSRNSSLLSRILGRWRNDPEFRNELGVPAILSLEVGSNSFEKLVFSESRELNPRTILKELIRIGTVKRTRLGLKLLSPVYVTHGNINEALSLLAEDTAALYQAIETNITVDKAICNLHIKTEYDHIPDSLINQAREWVLREGTAFQANMQEYLSQCDKDLNPSLNKLPGRNKITVVSFSNYKLS